MPAEPATEMVRPYSLPATIHRTRPFIAFLCLQAGLAWFLLRSLTPDLPGGRADAGYYLHYMQTLGQGGWSSLPGLFQWWNGDVRHWLYPPPTRIGFFAALWLTQKLVGSSLLSIAYLSTAAHLCAVSVNWLFARRHMSELEAFLFALALGCSPALLGIARLPLSDSFVCFCSSLVVWTFYELVREPSRIAWRVAFALSFFVAILTKELSALTCIPLAGFALLERYQRNRPLPLGTFAALVAIPGLLAIPLVASAAGSLQVLADTIRIVLQSPKTNAYVAQYCSGPWYRYIIDYLCFSPAYTLLAVGGAGALATRLRAGNYERLPVFFATLGVGLLIVYAPLIKNLRYMLLLETSLRMLAIWLLCQLLVRSDRLRSRVALVACVALLCSFDLRSFQKIWIEHAGYDPVTSFLLDVRDIVPARRR